MVTIPAGATHILVRQQGSPSVRSLYLALKLPDGSYALNGEIHHDITPVELRQALEKYEC